MNQDLMGLEMEGITEIFVDEKDKTGTDLLAMSNFFNMLIINMGDEIRHRVKLETINESSKYFGEIISALKYGYHISNIGMLVADTSHFDKDLIDGIDAGLYHIAESKEVPGNLRPVIIDNEGKFKKFFTLRWAVNPVDILSDLTAMSMQAMLRDISEKLDEVRCSLNQVNENNRKNDLKMRFLYARDLIMEIPSEKDEGRKIKILDDADTYLMEGIAQLYEDLNTKLSELSKSKGVLRSLKKIDELLQYISEDMCMLPKYIGFRGFLLYKRKKYDLINSMLGRYDDFVREFSENKINKKYTAAEIVHNYYEYNGKNRDFWLEYPKRTIESVTAIREFIENKKNNVIFVCGDETSDWEVCES